MKKYLISDFPENTSNINIPQHTKSVFDSDFRKYFYSFLCFKDKKF